MSKKILIIDDSASFRTVVKLALQKNGFEVVEAVNGKEGVAKIQVSKPSMVVCDLNMPEMDGFTFAETARKTLAYRAPILMLTTESSADKKEKGKKAGISAWITKPFTPAQLVAAVTQLCP